MKSVNQHLGKMSKILFFYYYLPLFLTIRHHLFYVALSDDEGLYYFCCLGCEQQNICNDAGCQHNMHEVALLLYSSHSRKLIKKFLFQTFLLHIVSCSIVVCIKIQEIESEKKLGLYFLTGLLQLCYMGRYIINSSLRFQSKVPMA